MTATAMMLAAGIAAVNHTEAQAAKKVAINKKNFPDQVFRELVKSNYDKNKDKKLSTSEIRKAKKFGTSSCKTTVKIKKSKYGKYEKKYIKDIKNFKGVEKLTNLQKFVANETTVKTINLKKNKNLTYLEMTEGSLQKLDLNNNKKLKYVYLQYNKLTSLKMNKCKKLLKVNLTGHMVKNLKIDRNKKTKVDGEEYYVPFTPTKIKESFANLNEGGQIDSDGNYCIYEWSADHTSCVKKTINGTGMSSQPVALDAAAAAKAKGMQKITSQWKDTKGNFYFLADKDGDMVAQTVYYLIKVNPQGGLEAEVNLKDMMLEKLDYGYRYSMTLLNQNDSTAIVGIEGKLKDGVIYIDLNDMVITKQATSLLVPKAAEGDIVICLGYGQYALACKMNWDNTDKLENGREIQYCELGLASGHEIRFPVRSKWEDYSELAYPSAIQLFDNQIYVITGEGFFKAKLTAKKFTQLYGVGKMSGMQESTGEFFMTMKNEKEIYLMTKRVEDDTESYSLQACKIQ